jgi:hypothetical protein
VLAVLAVLAVVLTTVLKVVLLLLEVHLLLAAAVEVLVQLV